MRYQVSIIGGTGAQGFGLALRWARAGLSVCIGSRSLEKAKGSASKVTSTIGRPVKVDGFENPSAAGSSDTVVIAVPFEAHYGILKSIKPNLRDGAVLIDVTVPLATAIGGPPSRTLGLWEGSAAEQARRILPTGVKVVAAFTNVSSNALVDLGSPVDCDSIICTDEEAARERTFELCKQIPGLNPVDGGPLENSRIVESITALLITINMRYGVDRAGIRITGLRSGSTKV